MPGKDFFKLIFSNPYIFATQFCIPWTFKIRSNMAESDILEVYTIVLQSYRIGFEFVAKIQFL